MTAAGARVRGLWLAGRPEAAVTPLRHSDGACTSVNRPNQEIQRPGALLDAPERDDPVA